MAGYTDSQDIYHELISIFPKLREGGGLQLLRTHNEIDVPPSGYCVSYLKAVVHNAKIYIRPLQKELSIEPENDEVRKHHSSILFLLLAHTVQINTLHSHYFREL